jgi:hypothetical protein
LEEKLGQGGMGVVWRATDLDLGRVVAVKRAHSGDGTQMRREARIGAGLHHPHVVTVFDVVADADERWLVMEYLPSRSVATILGEDGPLPVSEVSRIGAHVADALVAMHANQMVHRDVTPGNVLVAADGTAKLTDLGIARWAEATVTGGAQLGGSSGYLAPEVVDGHEAGYEADVFALGATLFAAVEGVSPWGDGEQGPFVQLRRAVAFQAEPMRRAGPLAPVLAALMDPDPARRPTAAEARGLLTRGVVESARTSWPPPSVPPSSPPAVPRRSLAGRRGFRVLAAGLVVAAVGVGGVRLLDRDQGDAEVGVLGDPRTADPCALLVPTALDRFGKTYREPNYGNFNHCDLITDQPDGGGNVDVAVDLELPEENPPIPPVPGRLGPPVRYDLGDNLCKRSVTLPSGDRVVISARQVQERPAELCAMADAVVAAAYGVLNQGPIPRRVFEPAPASLAQIDACALLGPADLTGLVPADPPGRWGPEPGFGGWACSWGPSAAPVSIRYSREWPLAEDPEVNVRRVRAGDRDAFVGLARRVEGRGICEVSVPFRRYRPDLAAIVGSPPERDEVVVVGVARRDVGDPGSLCPAAVAVAGAAAGRLPPPGSR